MIKEYVLVEAREEADVKELCAGIPGRFLFGDYRFMGGLTPPSRRAKYAQASTPLASPSSRWTK